MMRLLNVLLVLPNSELVCISFVLSLSCFSHQITGNPAEDPERLKLRAQKFGVPPPSKVLTSEEVSCLFLQGYCDVLTMRFSNR